LRARLLFRSVWWLSNILLIIALLVTMRSEVWEFSTRKCLKGFSDAIVGCLADLRLKIPGFHLRGNLVRATAVFFSTPEIN
jgi:hypothetical protein